MGQTRDDAAGEAFQLDTLLRDAAMAWAKHARASGSRAGQYRFVFKPGAPPHDADPAKLSFNLSVTVEADDSADWATRIELDKFRGGHGKPLNKFDSRRFFRPINHLVPFPTHKQIM